MTIKITSDFADFSMNINKILMNLLDIKLLVNPLKEVWTASKKRIFSDGINSDERLIGTYSTSYVKERIKAGKGSSTKVILDFTDSMMNDYQAGISSIGFNDSDSIRKADWNELKYGKIFNLTRNEVSDFFRILVLEINIILKG